MAKKTTETKKKIQGAQKKIRTVQKEAPKKKPATF